MSSGVYNAAGTRLTKSGVTTTAYTVDPEVVLSIDLYTKKDQGRTDTQFGQVRTVLYKAGTVLRQSVINKLFPTPRVFNVYPSSGAAAGGTAVKIVGNFLDGVTAVTLGGVAVTSRVIVNGDEMTFVTGAHAAGLVDMIVTDDSGTATFVGAYTYV